MPNSSLDIRPPTADLERKITLGFGAALLMMCIVSVACFISIREFNSYRQWSDHTRDVLQDIADLRSAIKDADSDVRGFIIAGEEKYADAFHAHSKVAAGELSKLRQDTRDNAAQQTRLAQLDGLMQEHGRMAEDLLTTRRDKNFYAAQELFTVGAEKQYETMRQSLESMIDTEEHLLASRTAAQAKSGRISIVAIVIGSSLAFGIVIAAALYIKRDAARRHLTQEHLDNVFRLSQDLICIADFRGFFRAVNPAWTHALGYTREEIISRPFLDFIHPDDVESTNLHTKGLAEGKEVLGFENRYRCKDGSYRWLTWQAVPGPDGKKIYATARDVTHAKEIEQNMRLAQAQAQDANESKSRFLANMSHEIRTPMAAIIGYADLILEPNQTPSDRLEHINTIRRNGEHLLTIINDVLDLSKIEAGKFQVQRVACCPCQILSDVASSMRVRALEKMIRLEVKNEGVVPGSIRTDAARLRQILFNLVGNAIKFTDEGWVRLIMRLDERNPAAPRLRFDILDTGIGMSREQMAQLFQPFVQVDGSTTRRFGGTGLGLTISKRLAELLGGLIEVDSSPGRGSTFTVFIDPGNLDGVPRLKNCREALAGIAANQQSHRTVTRLSGRVLLVDDGRDNRQLLSVYLRDAGAEVALAENGREGAEAALAAVAAGKPFGVILMDMQMPELDGYGASSLLRSKGYAGPIVALTAHAFAEDREKCLKAGCTDYLSKPVRRQDLLDMVWKHLNPGKTQVAEEVPVEPDEVPEFPTDVAPLLSNEKIQSELQHQPRMRHLVDTYIADLPAKVAALESAMAALEMDQLATVVHDLKGTGGLYGLMSITDAAAGAELLIHGKGRTEAIKAEVDTLIKTLRRVEGYGSSAAAPQSSEIPTA